MCDIFLEIFNIHDSSEVIYVSLKLFYLHGSRYIVVFFLQTKVLIFLLFLPKNICCGYSLEAGIILEIWFDRPINPNFQDHKLAGGMGTAEAPMGNAPVWEPGGGS